MERWFEAKRKHFDDLTKSFDDLFHGWVNSFVTNLRDELYDVLGDFSDDFVVLDCKEKYGSMVIYWSWRERPYTIDELMHLNELYDTIESILRKYSKISNKTCVVCGKPAEEYSGGWVLPFCYDCYKNGAF